MSADAAPLAVVGHQDHGGALELAALLEEGEEVADVTVGMRHLLEVLRAAHTADVAELVRGEELEHEQVGVLLLDHATPLGAERAVDLGSRLHGADGSHDVLPERVEQMRDPHESPTAAVRLEHVEDRLHPHAEPGGEVRAHAVLLGAAPVSIEEKQTTVRAG